MQINYKKISAFLFLSGFLLLIYFAFLFNPSQRIVKKGIEEEFISKMKIKAIVYDNALSQFMQGAKSISSRSMIRKKIVEYLAGTLSLQGLKDYTESKYRDGISALENIEFAGRYVKNQLLVSVGDIQMNSTNLKNGAPGPFQLRIGMRIENAKTHTYVISPIKTKKGVSVGYDLLFFNNEKIYQKIYEKNIQFQANYKNPGSDSSHPGIRNRIGIILRTQEKITYRINSIYPGISYSFSISPQVLYSDLQVLSRNQVLTIGLLVFSFALMLYIFYRREKFHNLQRMVDQERNFKWILENSNDAIAIRQDGRFVFFNESLEKLLDFSKEDLSGKKYLDFISPDEVDKTNEMISRNDENSIPKYTYETVLNRKDSNKVIVEVSEMLIKMNKRAAYFTVLRDITKQRELIKYLEKEADQNKGLKGIITVCASCYSIKSKDKPEHRWMLATQYLEKKFPEIQFSHGICPKCMVELYPDI